MSNVNGILWTFHRISPPRNEAKIHFFDNTYNVYPDVLEYYIISCLSKGFRFISFDDFLKNKNARGGGEKK